MKVIHQFENDDFIVSMSFNEIQRLCGKSAVNDAPTVGTEIVIEPALASIDRLCRAKQQIEQVLSSIENLGVQTNDKSVLR